MCTEICYTKGMSDPGDTFEIPTVSLEHLERLEATWKARQAELSLELLTTAASHEAQVAVCAALLQLQTEFARYRDATARHWQEIAKFAFGQGMVRGTKKVGAALGLEEPPTDLSGNPKILH